LPLMKWWASTSIFIQGNSVSNRRKKWIDHEWSVQSFQVKKRYVRKHAEAQVL
jgi:hypothetical protein